MLVNSKIKILSFIFITLICLNCTSVTNGSTKNLLNDLLISNFTPTKLHKKTKSQFLNNDIQILLDKTTKLSLVGSKIIFLTRTGITPSMKYNSIFEGHLSTPPSKDSDSRQVFIYKLVGNIFEITLATDQMIVFQDDAGQKYSLVRTKENELHFDFVDDILNAKKLLKNKSIYITTQIFKYNWSTHAFASKPFFFRGKIEILDVFVSDYSVRNGDFPHRICASFNDGEDICYFDLCLTNREGIKFSTIPYIFDFNPKVQQNKKAKRLSNRKTSKADQLKAEKQSKINEEKAARINEEIDSNLKFKKNRLTESYGVEIANKIMDGKVWIGMSKAMAIESIGYPEHINTTVNSYAKSEQYCYKNSIYLYFRNGILESVDY